MNTCEGGVTVRWCPRCGTCTCPDQQANPDGWVEDPFCPIHGARSEHKEPRSAAFNNYGCFTVVDSLLVELGLNPDATIQSVQRRLHVGTADAMRLLALREGFKAIAIAKGGSW